MPTTADPHATRTRACSHTLWQTSQGPWGVLPRYANLQSVRRLTPIQVDVHSTVIPGTLLKYDVITIGEGEGEGEGDQPIISKCRVRK